MQNRIIAAIGLLLTTFTFIPMAQDTNAILDEHTPSPMLTLPLDSADESERWVIINDTVMGGVSRASLTREGDVLQFNGYLSLDNNGGFASIRRISDEFASLPNGIIQISVKGDGRRYQLRLRTNKQLDGVAYVATFETSAGELSIAHFSAQDFRPQWRGRAVRNARELRFDDIHQLGFMLADKTEGPFALSILDISVLPTAL